MTRTHTASASLVGADHLRVGAAMGLPTEMVEYIFGFFSKTFAACYPESFPWFLGHICSRWRSIFLSMIKHFWRKISIFYPTPWDYDHDYGDVVRFFLQRKPEAPFSFHFTLSDTVTNYSQGASDIFNILEMMTDESMRWDSLLFDALLPEDLLLLARAKNRIKNRIPLLRTVQLHTNRSAGEPLNDMFQTAPSLNAIEVYHLLGWQFNWSNLTDVVVRYMRDGDLTALSQMTKLERLSMNGNYCDDTPSDVIVLPRLTSLVCGPTWLPLLNAPALETLSVYDIDRNSFDVVLSFIQRSSCDISHFGIHTTQSGTVLEIIRHTPNLISLNLHDIHDIGLVLEKLTVPTEPGPGQLVRHMESLDIIYNYAHDTIAALRQLPDLISSRTGTTAHHAGCAELRRLEICRSLLPLASPDTLKTIATLCNERGVQSIWLHKWIKFKQKTK
ncbi:hypothetical protein APHAL10511_003219 [Amanita phalloides]|nr:hypothetical protein APHAL10511_003219 [Amanita phalloides]